ncbi:DUF427 domain-containing protein [Streptomyces maoxianensis]|uniref:DUF427 domain-containing protein n=1 Tax=Streptomyces maoxianensis TaxID=1459942 RepID=A0ABV9G633_9ACTN
MRHLANAPSASPQTARTARDLAMHALDTWGGCRRRDDIRACVSELAGNAVQHGSPDDRDYLVRLIRHPPLPPRRSPRQRAPLARTHLARLTERGSRARHGSVQELCDDWRVRAPGPYRRGQCRLDLLPPARGPHLPLLLHALIVNNHDPTPGCGQPPTPHRKEPAMGLSWQQGPLSAGAIRHFLTPEPLPERLLFAERLRRRMRVKFNDTWIADSENVILLHEPGRYPVAYFPREDVDEQALVASDKVTHHKDLGDAAWYAAHAGDRTIERAAWEFTALPGHAAELQGRIAFAWRAMDAFYEEDERILGHAADPYHRIDIRNTSRTLEVRLGDTVIARSEHPVVLFESGFAPRWYVPRADIDETRLRPVEGQTFCPYKGLCDYYDIGDVHRAAWSYRNAYREVDRIADLVSFEADKVEVYLDGKRLHLEPGQNVVPHGVDRDLDVDEVKAR